MSIRVRSAEARRTRAILVARALVPVRPKTFDELGEQVTGHGFTPR